MRGVAVPLVVVLSLTACSGGDPGGVTVEPPGTTESPAATLPVVGETLKYDPNSVLNEGKPISLDWWVWHNAEGWQELADAYKQVHPNVSITVVNQPYDDYWTKLPLELQGSNGPAIFNMHNQYQDLLIPYMAPYDIPAEELAADFTGAATHVIDGKTYYIDLGLMSGAIYYNTDMWKAAGLTDADIPKDWDQFRELAKKLTVRDGGKLKQAGFNFNGSGSAFQSGMAYQLGQNLFEDDGATPALDNEANLEVVKRFLDFYADGSGDRDFGTDAGESFGQGLSAMIYNWGWYAGTLKSTYPDLNWATFQTPVPNAGETPYAYDRSNGESTFGINANADEAAQSVAQDFLRYFLTNKDFMVQICVDYGVFPAYKPAATAPELKENPALTAFADIEHYIWPGPVPGAVWTAQAKMWEDILYNGIAPADALKSAQAAAVKGVDGLDFVSTESLYPGFGSRR
jgi:multiple sugar transport system substrate-binding protein